MSLIALPATSPLGSSWLLSLHGKDTELPINNIRVIAVPAIKTNRLRKLAS